jgi:glycine dehydrogenase
MISSRLARALSAAAPRAAAMARLSACTTAAAPFVASRRLATADTSSQNYQKVYNESASCAVSLDKLDTFARRHLGPTPANVAHMLKTLGYSDLDEFLLLAIPHHVLRRRALQVTPQQGFTESEMLQHLHELASRNKIVKSFIGKGYAGTRVPPVIQRNLLESPEWYTLYTPYQPEISQGRLELLLNYQTMVTSLTGLPMANASLLDEGTAAGEAMSLSFHSLKGKKTKYVVDTNLHPQTVDVMRSRAANIGVELVPLPLSTDDGLRQLKLMALQICGALVQYPGTDGSVNDYTAIGAVVHEHKALLAVATDLLALTLLKPPSEFGADIALGTLQRFGVPFGYGGPHAAFFATNTKYSRKIPGRIVGLSKDRLGKPALRLALQTREQHIKREKATSNICTAQALLANMSAMYAVYHGPEGLKNIAKRVYGFTTILAHEIEHNSPHRVVNDKWFDTLTIELASSADEVLQQALERYNINLFRVNDSTVLLQLDETVAREDLEHLVELFTTKELHPPAELPSLPQDLLRTDKILDHPVFQTHHSETSMLRYLHLLQSKDLSLANSMIPLGSCTMKLNATVEMQLLSIPGFNLIHPFAPLNQAQGYRELVDEFEKDLNDITGFDATTLMPNSGAQGEYTGLTLIRQYHKSRGEYDQRNICLIPVSAHGTNPASAAMCGLKVVPVKCLANGSIDLEDLKLKAAKHAEQLCSIMITYPSTYGLFEAGVKDAIDIVHAHGGQVYLDGANMNAQVGLTSPGDLGADVCHLNIHKTFALLHGGGGPGQAPVCVKSHLEPFLPKHRFLDTPHSTLELIEAVNSAPYGSASVIPVSYLYIKMLGAKALPFASSIAMLNANYMLHRLLDRYQIMFVDSKLSTEGLKHCAHEFILDLREFKLVGVEAIDVAKRLQDYGFHAPTMSFPVAGTLMIEPTESENLEELDRFVDSLLAIRQEIDAYAKGEPLGMVLKNAPHSLEDIVSTPQLDWDARGYTREQAAYPLAHLKYAKCWPTVARVDDTYGDMNLMCTCPLVEEVVEAQA